MCDLYKEYLESGETDLEYFDWLDNQILLRSRDRKIEEANKKIKEIRQRTEETIGEINQRTEETIEEINQRTEETIEEINQRTEEANKKYENLINEIKEMIDETKESIIKYSQLKFHEDISSSINTLSKNQIFDLLDHLYDFKEFDELKKYLQNLKI